MKKVKHNINYIEAIPFIVLHLICLLAFVTGVTTSSVVLAISLYFIRMWAVTAGYHRYFSHKSFKTSRVFQFILAFLAQTSLQRGVLKWANHHRLHHRNSDAENDVHSPRRHGFWYAHIGWVFDEDSMYLPYEVKDLQKYPELVWLDKYKFLPAILLAIACFLIAGWPGLIVGFFISTVCVFHATFFINSLTHVFGSQRFLTSDDSRNNFITALITLGEGWHNNHHYYQASVRQGFYWWEIDITYYVLKVLSWFGIVWDLQAPPEKALKGERKMLPYQMEQLRGIVLDAGVSAARVRRVLEQVQHASHQEGRDSARRTLQQLINLLQRMKKVSKVLPPKAGELAIDSINALLKHCQQAKVSADPNALITEMLVAVDQWPEFTQDTAAKKAAA
ncbi:Fatty acid desaturase [Piscirickettsia salmonis]|uniref:Fatty acid desaturase family protein n=1 Tax=Piscirickettsia salmonis TaxID=1238 RepID=A0AAC8VJN3_PISSA|nr:acyl-CoA desaturase [Piscirickettsia salmonis]AKP72773.1 hypothetical protein PSLF89_651 [Piscirickettsia salmonis LF-89 = ATCC VR-1361]ALB23722.1 fatty acid desaturase family protein [Piscirickettsia salmonis]ALY03575.1 hypothetical protein AWE47_12530 [Piscirickettsia salmonis]AMA43140.1 hypothetical protein AWJ11_12760 [Piscirickettsia salmonis]AOS35611.1 hypothetical protein AVM72_09885 [Piscirickettsia salmonis]